MRTSLFLVHLFLCPLCIWAADDLIVLPEPQSIACNGAPVPIDAMVGLDCKSANIRSALLEVARQWGFSFCEPTQAGTTAISVGYGDAQQAAKRTKQEGEQGYTLKVTANDGKVSVVIAGGDEAGAYYAVQTLRDLLSIRDGKVFIQPAAVSDWPAFKVRGAIFGYDRGALAERLKTLARLKLNLALLVGVSLDDYKNIAKPLCDANFIRIMISTAGGGSPNVNAATDVCLAWTKAGLTDMMFSFDDIMRLTPESAEQPARDQCAFAKTLIGAVRKANPNMRFYLTPVCYGGLPSTQMQASYPNAEPGAKYLKIVGKELSDDMSIIWCGDGTKTAGDGTWSDKVTVAGLKEYRTVCGVNKVFFWDNNPLNYGAARNGAGGAIYGREPGIEAGMTGYMANLNEQQLEWNPVRKNGELTLSTIAMYTWKPETYDPAKAEALAAREVKRYLGPPRPALITFDHGAVAPGGKLQLNAHLVDQYYDPSNAALAWSVSGGGSIDAAGLFKSSGERGTFTVRAAVKDRAEVFAEKKLAVADEIFASDLAWISGSGFLPPQRDVRYQPGTRNEIALVVHGKSFKKGMTSYAFDKPTPADVVIDVDGMGFSEFTAQVGVSDGCAGSVQFVVLADDANAAESPVIRANEDPYTLTAKVAGAKTVILRVTNGGDGGAWDHAIWGDAKFLVKAR